MTRPERSVTVRRATLGDMAALARFQTDTWREAYAGLVPAAYLDSVGADERERRWTERQASGTVLIGLAVDGAGTVVGAASSCPPRDIDFGAGQVPERELSTLYVGASHRGTGVADRLTSFVIGDRSAYLWVFRDNPRAIAFYRRHRFEPDGHEKTDPDTGLDELRMARPGSG